MKAIVCEDRRFCVFLPFMFGFSIKLVYLCTTFYVYLHFIYLKQTIQSKNTYAYTKTHYRGN